MSWVLLGVLVMFVGLVIQAQVETHRINEAWRRRERETHERWLASRESD